jgi:hypothetical protein
VTSGKLGDVVEPIPRWGKVFLAVAGAALIAVVVVRVVDGSSPKARPAEWRIDPAADLAETTTLCGNRGVLLAEQQTGASRLSCAIGRRSSRSTSA